MSITIAESKERYHSDKCKSEFYTNSEDDDRLLERLQDTKTTLMGFLDAGKVATSEMAYEIEHVKHYKF